MTTVDFGRYKRIVQYFWDPEPTNDAASRSSIWCLGREYRAPQKVSAPTTASTPPQDDSFEEIQPQHSVPDATPPDSSATSVDSAADLEFANGEDGGWPSPFLDDFESRIWLTYRSSFPAIPKSQDPRAASSMSLAVRLRSQLVDQGGFTSDTGWGCMIRSGQSLLANALVMLEMGRGLAPTIPEFAATNKLTDWRRNSRSISERNILSLFADDPKAPYSIHRFVEHGAVACGKHPGEWFGPSATARCIE
jgi:cysteine protease ATG4